MKLRDHTAAFLDDICWGLREGSFLPYRQGVKYIVNLHGEKDPLALTSPDLRDWIERLGGMGLKPKTIKARLGIYRRYINWLADKKLIPEDTADIFIPRKLQRLIVINPPKHAVTEPEHQAMYAQASSGRVRYWWMTALLMGWHLGLRISDVSLSKWSNIDWSEKIYNETPLKTRRLGKTISIPIDPELFDYLTALKARPYYESPYIIPDMYGYYMEDPNALVRGFRIIADEAGVNPITTFHSYRHAFVSRLLNAGTEPIVIASMTGQTVKQIEEYAHISTLAKTEALERARALMHRERMIRNGMSPQG